MCTQNMNAKNKRRKKPNNSNGNNGQSEREHTTLLLQMDIGHGIQYDLGEIGIVCQKVHVILHKHM